MSIDEADIRGMHTDKVNSYRYGELTKKILDARLKFRIILVADF